VVRGVVKRIEAYGVFVGLDGFRRQGLVHASQVGGGAVGVVGFGVGWFGLDVLGGMVLGWGQFGEASALSLFIYPIQSNLLHSIS